MALETAGKASISITRAKSTNIGLNDIKRNKVFLVVSYMHLIEFKFFFICTMFTYISVSQNFPSMPIRVGVNYGRILNN